MFPCCVLCYDKYINEDGTIDRAVWMTIVLERRRRGRETPDPEDLCRCDCHKKGMDILH